MNGSDKVIVQVVMKNADGSSILTQETARAGAGDVDPARAAEIRAKLEALGFEVVEGNLNTLSVSGTVSQFETFFGLAGDAGASGVAAHAVSIAPELKPFVADAFIPPPPELFR